MTRFVLIKASVPDWYEAANCAVVEVTKDLVLMLDRRMSQTKAMADNDFYGIRWWDHSPYFIKSAGPETFGLDMDEVEFDNRLYSNESILLPESYEIPEKYAPIDTILLTINVTQRAKESGCFQWSGYDKHIGDTCRVTTYEMDESAIKEWAELIGCTLEKNNED